MVCFIKFDWFFQEKCDCLTDYIRRLKPVIRWFQELEVNYLLEHEKLQDSLEVSELKRSEMGMIHMFVFMM